MSTTYDLIGRRLEQYLLTADKAKHDLCFVPYPSDLVYSGLKGNDKTTVATGVVMGNITSQAKNFVANGMTWDPCTLADLRSVQAINAVVDLEGKTTAGIYKLPDGTLYIAVQGEVTATSVKAVVEAAMGCTFYDAGTEFRYTANPSPVKGIYGTIEMPGYVIQGNASVYKIGSDTGDVVPAANIGKIDPNPAA